MFLQEVRVAFEHVGVCHELLHNDWHSEGLIVRNLSYLSDKNLCGLKCQWNILCGYNLIKAKHQVFCACTFLYNEKDEMVNKQYMGNLYYLSLENILQRSIIEIMINIITSYLNIKEGIKPNMQKLWNGEYCLGSYSSWVLIFVITDGILWSFRVLVEAFLQVYRLSKLLV